MYEVSLLYPKRYLTYIPETNCWRPPNCQPHIRLRAEFCNFGSQFICKRRLLAELGINTKFKNQGKNTECPSYEPCSFPMTLFILRLSSKLLKQGYLAERLKSSFRKFYGQYGDLIQQYEVSLSRMLNDILILDQQWLPNQSDFPPISWPWYRAWPSPNYEWFPWSICNGCG